MTHVISHRYYRHRSDMDQFDRTCRNLRILLEADHHRLRPGEEHVLRVVRYPSMMAW